VLSRSPRPTPLSLRPTLMSLATHPSAALLGRVALPTVEHRFRNRSRAG
jgi:hypothetical protein